MMYVSLKIALVGLGMVQNRLIKYLISQMEVILKRQAWTDNSTIGELTVNKSEFICYTLENKDRGLKSDMSDEEIKSLKVQGSTAIPYGTYIIDMNSVSPRFS
jgi:hypothetical protein